MAILSAWLLVLLPFEHLPSWEFHSLTIRLSSLLILGFIVVGGPWLIASRRVGPMSRIDWAILALVGSMFLSSLTALDPTRGYLVTALTAFVAGAYVLISRGFGRNFNWSKISLIVVLVAAATALFGLYQFLVSGFGIHLPTGLLERYTKEALGFPRIQSVAVEPLYYANYLILPLSILLVGSFLGRSKRFEFWILWLLALTLTLTVARSGYIAIFASLVTVLVLARQHLSNQAVPRTTSIIVAAIAMALVLIFATARPQGLRTFFNHTSIINSPVEESTSIRLARSQEAWQLFLKRPILGIGPGNYSVITKIAADPAEGSRPNVKSQFLETLAETGVVGFAALLWLLWELIRKLKRQLSTGQNWLPATALAATLVGLVIQYNFLSTIYLLNFWVVIGLISAIPETEIRG